jgi:hypothetical protein
MDIAQLLFGQIVAAGVPIVSLSIGMDEDKSTWTVLPSNLQSAAQPTIDAFDVSAEQNTWQWYVVRTDRDKLLYGCDWTQGNDTPLDTSEVTAWATYREALRNIPQDQSDPFEITWPTPPFVINPPPV